MKRLLLLALILLLVTMIACTQVAEAIKLAYTEKTPKYKVGDYKESIKVDEIKRTYLLHIPKGFNSAQQYPLILLFHGGGGSGKGFAKQTGFSDYADEGGVIAVYPDGIKHNWNDGRDTTDAYKAGADDIKFIQALVISLKSKLPIDDKRIYAAGVSNGGIFSHRLGCEMADTFAVIGTVVGPIATKFVPNCAPSKPISVVGIQGTVDPIMPIGGGVITGVGDGGEVESAENSMKFWAKQNGCETSPKEEYLPAIKNDGTRVKKFAYSQCKNNADVVYYIVEGMGHGWPPKKPQAPRKAGPTSQNIDATQVIWEFFKQHSKDSVPVTVIGPGKHTREVPGWGGRPYDLYVPQEYVASKFWPVVLVLHGGGGSSETAAQLTCPGGNLQDPKCLNKLADREGFIVAYPNGAVNPQNKKDGRRWNAGGGKNGYACSGGFACATGIDDIGYFNALLDDLQKTVSVDADRVYATGLSNGGSMSHRLACELSNRIAAIAPLASGNQFSAVELCQPIKAVPVLHIHGTDDSFWPYLGGEGGLSTGNPADKGVKISAPDTIKGWVSRNGCAASPVETTTINPDKADKTSVKKERYTNCRDGAEVVLYTVAGGGHTWPDGWQYLPKLTVGKTSKDINANEVMWQFFKLFVSGAAQQTPAGSEFPFGLSNPYEDNLAAKKALPQILQDLGLSEDENGAGFVVDNIARKDAEKDCDDTKCGRFDFSQAKELIDLVVGEGKTNLWVVISPVTNYKFTDGKKRADDGKFLPEGPVSRQAYKDYLTALVQYMTDYGRKVSGNPDWHVVRWNLYNEVIAEYKANYNKDMEQATRAYADFVIDSAEVLRRLTPQSKIVLAGAGSNTDLKGADREFYKLVFAKLKQANLDYEPFDYWETHWFGEASGYAKNGDGYGVKDFISFLNENGFGDKEFLIRAGGTYSGQDTQERKRLMDNFQSEEQQASYLFKRFIFNAAAGAKKIPWSTTFEHPKYQGSLHVHFNYIGLIYNGVPDDASKGEQCVKGWLPCPDPGAEIKKLSYYTFKLLVEKLKGGDFGAMKTLDTGIPNVFLYELTRQGKPIYVAWWDSFEEKGVQEKSVMLSVPGITSSRAKVTEAVPAFNPDFQSSTNKLNEADYPKFFKTYTIPVTDNYIPIILTKKPVYIEPN